MTNFEIMEDYVNHLRLELLFGYDDYEQKS